MMTGNSLGGGNENDVRRRLRVMSEGLASAVDAMECRRKTLEQSTDFTRQLVHLLRSRAFCASVRSARKERQDALDEVHSVLDNVLSEDFIAEKLHRTGLTNNSTTPVTSRASGTRLGGAAGAAGARQGSTPGRSMKSSNRSVRAVHAENQEADSGSHEKQRVPVRVLYDVSALRQLRSRWRDLVRSGAGAPSSGSGPAQRHQSSKSLRTGVPSSSSGANAKHHQRGTSSSASTKNHEHESNEAEVQLSALADTAEILAYTDFVQQVVQKTAAPHAGKIREQRFAQYAIAVWLEKFFERCREQLASCGADGDGGAVDEEGDEAAAGAFRWRWTGDLAHHARGPEQEMESKDAPRGSGAADRGSRDGDHLRCFGTVPISPHAASSTVTAFPRIANAIGCKAPAKVHLGVPAGEDAFFVKEVFGAMNLTSVQELRIPELLLCVGKQKAQAILAAQHLAYCNQFEFFARESAQNILDQALAENVDRDANYRRGATSTTPITLLHLLRLKEFATTRTAKRLRSFWNAAETSIHRTRK